jgi:hypothetical protein
MKRTDTGTGRQTVDCLYSRTDEDMARHIATQLCAGLTCDTPDWLAGHTLQRTNGCISQRRDVQTNVQMYRQRVARTTERTGSRLALLTNMRTNNRMVVQISLRTGVQSSKTIITQILNSKTNGKRNIICRLLDAERRRR